MNYKALTTLVLALTMAACVPRPVHLPPPGGPPTTEPGPAPPPPSYPQPTEQPRPPGEIAPRPPEPHTLADVSSEAVIALVRRGNELAAQGHYRRAAAAIERALVIEPRNPFVYHRLAQLRLQQGRFEQARAMARKSNGLSVDNPYLRARNLALIAEALRAQGKAAAARAAASRAARLRQRLQ